MALPAEASFREGRLDESLTELQQQVRDDPSSVKHRIFLFQLLAVMGQWERALSQLEVLGEMDASTLAMVQVYREALGCEMLRAEIFEGRRTPLVFGEPEQWLALLMEALRLTAEGRHAQSQDLRKQAFDAAPATSGTLDGARFEWIADADPRLGPVLEVIVNARYYWVPFHRVREIRLEAPSDVRDLVWTPVQLVWANGGQAVGLVPTRYPGSEASDDPGVRMARKTDWIPLEEDLYVGLGQRMLTTDTGEHPLLDTRLIQLGAPVVPGGSA